METYQLSVHIPSHEEFSARFPQYGRFAREDGLVFFDLLMSATSFNSARVATVDLKLPAVAGVARICAPALEQNDVHRRDFLKQYIGALVCTLMEANGFEKTGEKRAVSYPGFTKGEVYRQKAQGE